MFDILFGWRKASKCKKLIKRVRCRLHLLKNKRLAVAEQSRIDIVQLLKYGYKQVAFNRLDGLYLDESMISLYELLDRYSEFIILNLSYIRRHKDLPNDVNEAVSSLIFASARCGDLPELMLVRKLFGERYGQKFIIRAVELYPGNLVNQQVKEKLIPHSATEDVKNRLLDEIVRIYFCRPGVLPLDYKPDFQLQPKEGTVSYEHEEVLALEYKPEYHAPPQKVTEFYEDEVQDTCINENSSISSTSCSIMLHSSSPLVETPEQEKVQNCALMSAPYEYETGIIAVREVGESEKSDCSSEFSTLNSEESIIYLDDVQEFKSPTKQGNNFEDQDQRFFFFNISSLDDTNLDRKRMRRSASREKQNIENLQCEIYYGFESSNRRKYQKKVRFEEEEGCYFLEQDSKELETSNSAACRCSLHQPCYFCTNDNSEGREIRDYMDSPLSTKCRALKPYVRAATMPERREMEVKSAGIVRSSSLPVEKAPQEYTCSRNSESPSHVHPKLPDYDEIAAKFRELKRVYQLNRSIKF